jgi:hypothetical protein
MILTPEQALFVYNTAVVMPSGSTLCLELPEDIQVNIPRAGGPVAVWKKYTELAHYRSPSSFAKAYNLSELY